ncbi:MAG: hypothetical protein INQ03_00745 [Candidatus Heimdallarchaeota archaeon]|nr:hypothetical protein [Candidatus Heimdallarchaeota archaeon]
MSIIEEMGLDTPLTLWKPVHYNLSSNSTNKNFDLEFKHQFEKKIRKDETIFNILIFVVSIFWFFFLVFLHSEAIELLQLENKFNSGIQLAFVTILLDFLTAIMIVSTKPSTYFKNMIKIISQVENRDNFLVIKEGFSQRILNWQTEEEKKVGQYALHSVDIDWDLPRIIPFGMGDVIGLILFLPISISGSVFGIYILLNTNIFLGLIITGFSVFFVRFAILFYFNNLISYIKIKSDIISFCEDKRMQIDIATKTCSKEDLVLLLLHYNKLGNIITSVRSWPFLPDYRLRLVKQVLPLIFTIISLIVGSYNTIEKYYHQIFG